MIGQLYAATNEKVIVEDEIYAADGNFADFLGLTSVFKSQTLTLQSGYVLLSKSIAIKYFGKFDVIGQELRLKHKDNLSTFIVGGVYEDIPWNNTHRPEIIVDLSFYIKILTDVFQNDEYKLLHSLASDDVSYFLKRNTRVSELTFVQEFAALTKDVYSENRKGTRLILQRYVDIFHYSSSVKNDFINKGDYNNLNYYRISIIILLFITSFNFILMQTNLTSKRHLEIGIRKVHGANHFDLAKQFFLESFFLAIITIPFIAFYYLLYSSYFEGYLLPELTIHQDKLLEYILLLLVLLIGVLSLSTLYISTYVSGLKPIDAIYGKERRKKSKMVVLFMIVFVQFFVSLVLLNIAIHIYRQIDYGFSMYEGDILNKIMLVHFDTGIEDKDYRILKSSLASQSNVRSVTGGPVLPPSNSSSWRDFIPDNDISKSVICETYRVNEDFFDTYGLEVNGDELQYSGGLESTHTIVINQTGADAFGFDHPLGQRIEGRRVVGIVNDFHFHSLHQGIKPMIFYQNEHTTRVIAIRFHNQVNDEYAKNIQNSILRTLPDKLFEIHTFSEILKRLYDKDIGLKNFILFFTVLMSVIALIGLTGISLYYLNETAYSIAVKRVFGAPALSILKDFSKYFLLMIILAILLSIPISISIVSMFNANFAYALPFSFVSFIIISIGMVFFIIAFCLIILNKTLKSPPVKLLTKNR